MDFDASGNDPFLLRSLDNTQLEPFVEGGADPQASRSPDLEADMPNIAALLDRMGEADLVGFMQEASLLESTGCFSEETEKANMHGHREESKQRPGTPSMTTVLALNAFCHEHRISSLHALFPDQSEQLLQRIHLLEHKTVAELKETCTKRGFAVGRCSSTDLLRLEMELLIFEAASPDFLRKVCTKRGAYCSGDVTAEDCLQRLAAKSWEAVNIPIERFLDSCNAQRVLDQLNSFETATPLSLKQSCQKLDLLVEPQPQRPKLLARLRCVLIWNELSQQELEKDCIARSLEVTKDAPSSRRELIAQLVGSLRRDVLEACDIPVARVGLEGAEKLFLHLVELKRLSFVALKRKYTGMGVPLDPIMDYDDLVKRLQDLRTWEELPIVELRIESIERHRAHEVDTSAPIPTQKKQLIKLIFASTCAQAWESQGVPVTRLGGFEASAQLLHHYCHLASMKIKDITEEYRRLGLPDVEKVGRDTMLERLQQVSLWQHMPLVELRSECEESALAIDEAELLELADDEQRCSKLVWRLMMQKYLEVWEVVGLPVSRLGDVNTVMQAVASYQYYEAMNLSELQKAYVEVGLPQETGLGRQDLLRKLRSCVVWELFSISELSRECQSLQISIETEGPSPSEEELRTWLMDRLLLHLCQNAYEAQRIPARRLASMTLVKCVAERFDELEAMSMADLALEARKLGLPVRKNMESFDLRENLKDIAVWTAFPMEELRVECSAHGMDMKDMDFDIEMDEEEIRNRLLAQLLFHIFAGSFEEYGVPARILTSFQACAKVLQAWLSIDELTDSEITRKYLDLGQFPVKHVIRLETDVMTERLKRAALWRELPFLDLQRECQRSCVNCIATEAERDELIQRLVAKLWKETALSRESSKTVAPHREDTQPALAHMAHIAQLRHTPPRRRKGTSSARYGSPRRPNPQWIPHDSPSVFGPDLVQMPVFLPALGDSEASVDRPADQLSRHYRFEASDRPCLVSRGGFVWV